MILQRALIAGLVAVLAACAAPPEQQRAALPFAVREVAVDVSGLDRIRVGLGDAELGRTRAEVGEDVAQALRDRLAPAPEGTVDVTVGLTSVEMISRVEAAVPMAESTIKGRVSAMRAETGDPAVAAFDVDAGAGELRLPGALGILTAPAVEKDYRATVSGFAAEVEERLAGG